LLIIVQDKTRQDKWPIDNRCNSTQIAATGYLSGIRIASPLNKHITALREKKHTDLLPDIMFTE